MFALTRLLILLLILPFITTFIPAQQEYFTVKGSDFLEKTNYIFTGKLIDKKSYWSEDGSSIMTRHVFDVQDTVKGTPGGTVTVTEYGGTVGNRSMTLSHNSNYVLGQEYLVFTYVDLLKHNRTLAGPLGQFRVISDRGGSRVIRMYPSHPLRQVLGEESTAIFQKVAGFCDTIRSRVGATR